MKRLRQACLVGNLWRAYLESRDHLVSRPVGSLPFDLVSVDRAGCVYLWRLEVADGTRRFWKRDIEWLRELMQLEADYRAQTHIVIAFQPDGKFLVTTPEIALKQKVFRPNNGAKLVDLAARAEPEAED